MKLRLLNCIFSYNRYNYLKNTVESLNEFFPFGKTCIFDDGSDDTKVLKYLNDVSLKGIDVFKNNKNVKNQVHGGLHYNMTKALELANDFGYDYIFFLQDDVQFMWYDKNFLDKVEYIFKSCNDALAYIPLFFKRINYVDLCEYDDTVGHYRGGKHGFSDIGVASVNILNKIKFKFHSSESDTSRYWFDLGYRVYFSFSPVLAFVPWLATFRYNELQNKVTPPLKRYYLKPLSKLQIESLMNHHPDDLPFHEDFCKPLGWRCKTPYAYSVFNRQKRAKYYGLIWKNYRYEVTKAVKFPQISKRYIVRVMYLLRETPKAFKAFILCRLTILLGTDKYFARDESIPE